MRINIGRSWRWSPIVPSRLQVSFQDGQSLGHDGIRVVEFVGSIVRIDGVLDLIVASLVECAEVKPNLWDVGVQSDCSGICIESIAELIDFPVEDADRAPEIGIATVAIDGLLICLVRFTVIGRLHKEPAETVPRSRISWVYY